MRTHDIDTDEQDARDSARLPNGYACSDGYCGADTAGRMTAGHGFHLTKNQTRKSNLKHKSPQNHMKTKPNPEIDRQLDTEVRRRKAGIHEYTGFLLRAIYQLKRSHKTAIFTRAGATQCMLGKYLKDMEERGEIEVVGVKQMESNSKFVDEYSLTNKGERIVAEMLGLI